MNYMEILRCVSWQKPKQSVCAKNLTEIIHFSKIESVFVWATAENGGSEWLWGTKKKPVKI